MFGVVYCWYVRPGHDTDFIDAWTELTAIIRQDFGGQGSRLHHVRGQIYFAYAQWPSRQAWRQLRQPTERMRSLLAAMRAVTLLRPIHLHGEVLADLLEGHA